MAKARVVCFDLFFFLVLCPVMAVGIVFSAWAVMELVWLIEQIVKAPVALPGGAA